jgi:hypothetical protein
MYAEFRVSVQSSILFHLGWVRWKRPSSVENRHQFESLKRVSTRICDSTSEKNRQLTTAQHTSNSPPHHPHSQIHLRLPPNRHPGFPAAEALSGWDLAHRCTMGSRERSEPAERSQRNRPTPPIDHGRRQHRRYGRGPRRRRPDSPRSKRRERGAGSRREDGCGYQ